MPVLAGRISNIPTGLTTNKDDVITDLVSILRNERPSLSLFIVTKLHIMETRSFDGKAGTLSNGGHLCYYVFDTYQQAAIFY